MKISGDRAFIKSLGGGNTMAINGVLKYQACDDEICYFPASVPPSWQEQVLPWTASGCRKRSSTAARPEAMQFSLSWNREKHGKNKDGSQEQACRISGPSTQGLAGVEKE